MENLVQLYRSAFFLLIKISTQGPFCYTSTYTCMCMYVHVCACMCMYMHVHVSYYSQIR